MSNNDLVKISSITLAQVSLLACLFIWGQVSGFEKGYFYGVFGLPSPPPGAFVFSFSGPNFFQTINTWYFTIAVCFGVYIFGKSLKSLIVSSIICIFSLSVTFHPFWGMFSSKSEIIAMKANFPYDYWLKISVYFDWFLLSAVVILILVQFILILTRKIATETLPIT